MSALDDYMLRSEPLHTVDCAIRIPNVPCSCGADKMTDAARAELAAMRAAMNVGHADGCAGFDIDRGECGCGWLQREGAHKVILAMWDEIARLRAKVALADAVADSVDFLRDSLLAERLAAYRSAP